MKRIAVIVAVTAVSLSLAGLGAIAAPDAGGPIPAIQKKVEIKRGLSPIEQECIACHSQNEPGKVHDWAQSLHARANVTCLDCHRALATDKDAMDCPGTVKYRDVKISPVVTPKDCSRCHPTEFDQFSRSKHARTWDVMANQIQDPWLAGMNSGTERTTGCNICHGSDISTGKLTVDNWPNEGCGRINPDRSLGSCVICHTSHRFSIAEARKPETCGQCHLGPDHPQNEIYFESKHGKRYLAQGGTWNFIAAPDAWEPGSDFSAPTCAACHMSGLGDLATSHDVGERLKWESQAPLTVMNKDHDGNAERLKMLKVCTQCHSPRWAKNHLDRYDETVLHYNEEYFKPVKAKMSKLYEDKLLTPWPMFDEKIEWVFYEYWHHEGRRARMGAAMMGPDYAWWHGFYDLKKAYQEFMELEQQARRDGHGSPVYVPGSGGKNLTSKKVKALPAGWKDVKHLQGMPAK